MLSQLPCEACGCHSSELFCWKSLKISALEKPKKCVLLHIYLLTLSPWHWDTSPFGMSFLLSLHSWHFAFMSHSIKVMRGEPADLVRSKGKAQHLSPAHPAAVLPMQNHTFSSFTCSFNTYLSNRNNVWSNMPGTLRTPIRDRKICKLLSLCPASNHPASLLERSDRLGGSSWLNSTCDSFGKHSCENGM